MGVFFEEVPVHLFLPHFKLGYWGEGLFISYTEVLYLAFNPLSDKCWANTFSLSVLSLLWSPFCCGGAEASQFDIVTPLLPFAWLETLTVPLD